MLKNLNAFGQKETEMALLFKGLKSNSQISKLSRQSQENIIEDHKLPYSRMHGLDMAHSTRQS